MRFLSYVFTLLLALALTACGGGGGSSGSNPNRPTIFTTAPSALSMPLGVVQQYSVRGGVAPYTVSSDNVRVANASLRGDALLINSVGQGGASITIRDNNGGATSVAITVGDPLKLSMENVKSYVGDKIKVLITGGTPPYRVSTLETGVTGVVNGNELLLTLNAVSKVDVVVLDALDQQAKMNVEVITGSPQFNLVPVAQTISENSTQSTVLTVIGGVGPFTVRSSDTTLLNAAVSGNSVTLTTGTNGRRCVSEDTIVTVTVVDSRGAFATSSILIADNPAGCGLRLSAKSVAVIEGDTVKLTLEGLSNTGIVTLQSADPKKATATYSGGVITVVGVQTTLVPEQPAVPANPNANPPVEAKPAVPAYDDPVTITVIDSGPPTGSDTFKVSVLKKTP
ncbi:MAG: hypothetical protein ACWA6Y_02915 [Polaromonas sp.]